MGGGERLESTWSDHFRGSAAPPSGGKGELESGVDECERGACWVLSSNIVTSQLLSVLLRFVFVRIFNSIFSCSKVIGG